MRVGWRAGSSRWPAKFPGSYWGTGKYGIHCGCVPILTMRGKGCVRPGEFQHGRSNGSLACHRRAGSLFFRKSRQICGVIKMCVVGHHVHRSGPGEHHILLSVRLVIGGFHAARRIGISAGPRNFNQVRAQLLLVSLNARAAGQLHYLRGPVIRGSLGGGGGHRRSLAARVRRALLD